MRKKTSKPQPSGAVSEMMRAEFDEREFGVAGEFIVEQEVTPPAPVAEFTIPPPPWSADAAEAELDESELASEPELPPRTAIPAPPWKREEADE